MNQNIRLYNPTLEKTNWGYIIGYLIFFLFLPPFIGLPLVIGSIWKKGMPPRTDYYTFFFCIAAYLAAINATKAPSGDQINYCWAYLNVPTQGFIGSLKNIYGYAVAMEGEEAANISGEFMNGVYNYIGYYLTFGYYPLFAFLLTIADYMFIFLGLYKFSQTLEKPHIPTVCGVLTLSFFYLFFNYTLQIQKQFLAQSIMMYVLGSYAQTGKMTKKLWIVAICAVFTHASTMLFIPFIALKGLRNRLSKQGLLFMGVIFSLVIILGPKLAGNIVSSNEQSALTYGVSRLAQSETNNDMDFGLVWSQVLVIAMPLAIITLRKLWLERKTLNPTNAFILNITLLLLLAVIAMYRQPLAQYRYFMMLFALMPFVYPFISNNILVRNKFLKCLSVIMIVWFYYQFENIVWHYAPEIDIVIKSPVFLLFGNYYNV